MSPIVLAEHVFKRYVSPPSIAINQLFQLMGAGAKHLVRPKLRPESRYVLSDVSFSLEAGESLGLIGNNGAGKTSLFRLLAGISLPTKGRIRVEGRVASLLSLGAGFHPDMAGRENLYLNCTLMGL